METKKRKVVYIHYNIRDDVEEDMYVVKDFHVTYDAAGVLTVHDIIDQEVISVFYGPGTWKYVQCCEEEIVV